MATRWGIMSVGLISRDFTSGLVSQNQDEHQVTAVASRSLARSEEFAKRFGISTFYEGYEKLVQDPNVDIVYIGCIHTEHYRLSMMCLNAGKHVLVEKPMALTSSAANEVLKTAQEKKLFFMEGYWSRFFPIYKQLREELSANVIGDVLMTQACFSVDIQHAERVTNKELGGGGLMDIGCYPVMVADYLFQERPEKISAVGQVDDKGVDLGGVITLTYSGGRIASILYNIRTQSDANQFVIFGSKGFIRLESPFWCATKMTLPDRTLDIALPVTKMKVNFPNSEGFMYEQQHVRECLQKGLTESPIMPHSSSGNIMYTMETVLEQIGATYNFNKKV